MLASRFVPVSLLGTLVAAAVVLTPRDAHAATLDWVGSGGDGLWSNASNWNPAMTPADGDFLTFGNGSTGGRLTNDFPGLELQRITFEDTLDGYILEGNAALVDEIVASQDSGDNEVAFNVGGEGQTLVAAGATLILSGDNTFTGDIDIAGELEARTNTALGTAAGRTNILNTGELTIDGRDLGDELVRISPHEPGRCAIRNGAGDSVLRNVEIASANCIVSIGTLNFPNGLQPFVGEFDLLLFGNFIVGGTTTASGPLRLTGESTLAWNSSGPVDIAFEPFEELQPGGTLTGAGTAASLTFRNGLFKPGNGADAGRFTLTGGLSLEDVTLNAVLNGATTGTGYSQVQAGGTVALGPNTHLDITLGFTPTTGQSFRIIDNVGSGSVVGTFQDLPEGATFTRAGRTFTISYKAGTGNDVEITVTNAEPTDPRPFKLRLPMVARG